MLLAYEGTRGAIMPAVPDTVGEVPGSCTASGMHSLGSKRRGHESKILCLEPTCSVPVQRAYFEVSPLAMQVKRYENVK